MDEPSYVLAGSLIDGSGGEVQRNVALTVAGGRIVAIGPAGEIPRHGGGMVDDYSHCLVVPALVDCSVSLARSPALDSRVRAAAEEGGVVARAALRRQHARYCHVHGVLGVADADSQPGQAAGPDDRPLLREFITVRAAGQPCRSAEDCAEGVPQGADFLRIGYSADIEERDAAPPRLTPGDLRRIMERRGNSKAVVVANGRDRVAEALAAGCDAIEQGYGMGEANLRTMAERGVLWIPALVRAKNALDGAAGGGDVACRFSQRYVAPGKPIPGAESFWKQRLADQLVQLRRGRELGVVAAVGTGAGAVGILHGESVVEEMKLFLKAGYSLTETVRCASVNGALFFNMEKLGILAPGRSATFLIARGTVQQLPRKLAYLEAIYVNGAPSGVYRKNPVRAPFSSGKKDGRPQGKS